MTQTSPASIDIQVRILQLEKDLGEARAHAEAENRAILQLEHDLGEERAARQRAEAENRAKSELMATVSHEVRTPMGEIISMAELLLGTDLDERQRHFAETLAQSGRGLLTLLNDILDYSKLEAGSFELEKVPFDFIAFMQNIDGTFEELARDKGLASSMELADGFPVQLVGDPVRIRQILDILISNAVKFTDQGSIRVLAGYGHDGNDLVLRFEVHDTGIGLEQHQMTHLFKPYQQAGNPAAEKIGGTGLSLSIARQLAQLMGGDLGVESSLQCGSMFWFTLRLSQAAKASTNHPAPPAHVAEPGLTAAPRPADVPPGPLSGHVLVVEDNQINQMLIAAYLEQFGLSYETAVNGRDAVNMARNHHFDVVLMDIMMPVMDGMEATRQIRSLNGPAASVAIIALTAHAMKGDRETYLGAGMDGYVSKPVSAAELFSALSEHLAIEPKGVTSRA